MIELVRAGFSEGEIGRWSWPKFRMRYHLLQVTLAENALLTAQAVWDGKAVVERMREQMGMAKAITRNPGSNDQESKEWETVTERLNKAKQQHLLN